MPPLGLDPFLGCALVVVLVSLLLVRVFGLVTDEGEED